LPNGGVNLYCFFGSVLIPRPRIARQNVGDKLACLQLRGLSSYESRLRRNKNRKLRCDHERRREGNLLLRKNQLQRLAAFGGDRGEGGGWRQIRLRNHRRDRISWRRTQRAFSCSRTCEFGVRGRQWVRCCGGSGFRCGGRGISWRGT